MVLVCCSHAIFSIIFCYPTVGERSKLLKIWVLLWILVLLFIQLIYALYSCWFLALIFFPCCPLWFYSSTKVIISILISAPEPWCFFKINLNGLANSRTCSVTCTFHSFWCGYLNLQDLPFRPKYLVTFTVGIAQKDNINRAVKKVTFRDYLHLTLLLHPKFYCLVGTAAVFFVLTTSNSFVNIHISSWSNNFGKLPDFFSLWLLLQFSKDFAILLFHYDGRVTEWDEFQWSKRAIHVSVRKQAKWCVLWFFIILYMFLYWRWLWF